jgi:hypothetical protein
MVRTEFDPSAPDSSATGNDALYYQYFDCTVQSEFLYKALQRTLGYLY